MDFAGQDQIGKDRARLEGQLLLALGRRVQDLRPRDIRGQEVGCELNTTELGI